MTLKRVALFGIPVGLLLVIVGIVGYMSQSGVYPLLWVGLAALTVGFISAIAHKWRERPASD